jgi:hypothetical protein
MSIIKWLILFFLMMGSLVVCALVAERGLVFYEHREQSNPTEVEQGDEGPKGFIRREQRTGWVPRESAQVETKDPQGNPFVLRINSTAQRGDDIAPRSASERRILFLGDSFTMASSLPEEDTFVRQIGHRLAAHYPETIRTINGGVNGYSTYQELAYYRYFTRWQKPDIVVLCFFTGNDYRDNMVSTRQGRLLNPVLIPDPAFGSMETPYYETTLRAYSSIH